MSDHSIKISNRKKCQTGCTYFFSINSILTFNNNPHSFVRIIIFGDLFVIIHPFNILNHPKVNTCLVVKIL